MIAGFQFESKKDTFPDGLGAALILDAKEDWVGGMPAGTIPGLLIVRLFWKGDAPDVGWLCERTRYWTNRGAYVVLMNEPNHPNEGWGTENSIFRAYDVYSKVNISVPSARLIWVPPSPGFSGYESWFTSSFAKTAIHAFCGSRVGVHAYGAPQEIEDECWKVQQLTPDCERFLTEWNYGPAKGKMVDINAWAKGIPDLLTWLDGQGWTAAIYYQYKERNPDYPHETPVDAQGTDVESAVLSWKAPSRNQEPPVVAVSLEPHADPPAPVSNQSIRGIDVSNWQGRIDWDAVASATPEPYRFACIKATEDPAFIDPWFARNWAECRRVGMVRIAYCFARLKSSPEASVTLLKKAVDAAGGLLPGDGVALDIEDETFNGSAHRWVAEWLDLATRAFGFRPKVSKGRPGKYSGKWYTGTRDLEHPDLADYWSWWAAYQDQVPEPSVGWGPIRMWQHSAHTQVPGVVGDCDVNVFFGSVQDLVDLGLPEPEATPAPPQKPQLTPEEVVAVIEKHFLAAKLELGVA